MNTKFGYFFANSSTSKRAGYVTIAIARSDKENETHTASLSFCSPKDHFNKKLGRNISEGRLKSSKDSFSVNINGSVSDVIKGVMLEAIQNKAVPSWVYKAAKHGELVYGLNRNANKLPDCTSVFDFEKFIDKNFVQDMETSSCGGNCCCS